MITWQEETFIGTCIEGFFYGIYTGIFAMYLQYPPNKTRTTIIFYALCLLYVLTTATIVADLVVVTFQLRLRQVPPFFENNILAILIDRAALAQTTVSSCSVFIAQCIMIYRCWIVWGQNIRVVIIPSLLVITYLCIWLASYAILPLAFYFIADVTNYAMVMSVNALVTGLIVFRILKVFLEVKGTSSSTSDSIAGGTTLRHIIFVIIESGMALFASQMVRFILALLPVKVEADPIGLIYGINEMFYAIAPTMILVRVSMRISFDDEDSFREAVSSLRFNNPPSNPDAVQRVGSISSNNMPPQPEERSEDIQID